MSEFHAASATHATAPAAAAKPRISADAFRNLTARLKRPDVEIPSLAPALTPPAAPVVMQPVAPVESQQVAPVVEAIQPVQVIVPPVTMPVIPDIVVQPAFEPVVVPDIEISTVAPAAIEPIVVVAAPAPVVVQDLVEVVIDAPHVIEPLAEPEAVQVVIEEQQVVVDDAPQLQGSFEENFTFVPEPGKTEATPDAPIDLGGINAAVKKEVAERATELELENNWRMLLAKPTSEDRAQYLREARELHGDDDWGKPAAEFDLSAIEPAVVDVVDTGYEPPSTLANVSHAISDTSVAEGQDTAELMRSLLDMMAAGNQSGLPQERALAADTLLRLVPRLETKPLMILAQRLAMMDNPPALLVSRLIRDSNLQVAGPILEDCIQISDKDLESVVQEGDPGKMRMIARRRRLTRNISDSLIQSGDPSVVLTLVRNVEAEISHQGFESLLLLAENTDDLLAPLATRQDLGAQYAFQLFWLAPTQLRRFILSRFLTDSETLTKILKITMATNAEDDGEKEGLSQHALLEALDRAMRGQLEIATEELAGIMQVSQACVAKILGDVQGDAFVVMLKAAGYPRSSVTGLLKRMQDAELPLVNRQRDLSELQGMFETLSFNKARILLTYWDWAESKTGPYAPVH